jgi:hypothetical protein
VRGNRLQFVFRSQPAHHIAGRDLQSTVERDWRTQVG